MCCPNILGYVYLVFESEKSVRALLQACTQDLLNQDGLSEHYFKMSSRRMRCKEVQVIPWVLADSNFVRSPSQRLDPSKTVFVGALHGMLNAEALASIMNDLFGGVVYAGIDTDKHKYPIGSGRVTFNNQRSYLKAVSAAFVEIKTAKFTKKVQIDPYLEDSVCQACNSQPGPFFCRDQVILNPLDLFGPALLIQCSSTSLCASFTFLANTAAFNIIATFLFLGAASLRD
ncbi:hypothetical protein AB205_0159060, partial [Aquarana catesbeiana]